MNTYIREWQSLLIESMKTEEEAVDIERLREDILSVRDKLLVQYGVYQELVSFLKPSKNELAFYQEKMQNLGYMVDEMSHTIHLLEDKLIEQGVNIRRSLIKATMEERIKDAFRKEVFDLLVKQERRSLVVNETKRVEMRFPVHLLREIDEYQEIHEISNRSQTIFELCRMGLKVPSVSHNRVVVNSSMQRLKENYLRLKDISEQNRIAIEKMNFLLSEGKDEPEQLMEILKKTCEKAIRENEKYEKMIDGVVNLNE